MMQNVFLTQKESLRPTLLHMPAHSEVTLKLLFVRIQILNKKRKLRNHCTALELKLFKNIEKF